MNFYMKPEDFLKKNGINCIIAHTHDSFHVLHILIFQQESREFPVLLMMSLIWYMMMWNLMLNLQKGLATKHIILAGHSLGSNKIIHYLGNTSDDFVDYFIVSSLLILCTGGILCPILINVLILRKMGKGRQGR